MIYFREDYPKLTKRQFDAMVKRERKAALKRAKMRELPKMDCENCKTNFRPVKKWQRFCTNACRRANWSKEKEAF